MWQTVTFTLVSLLLTSGRCNPSTEYPQGCQHEDFTVFCEGSAIPKLEQKITTFQLKNANPSIPELSRDITGLLDHLVSLHFHSAGLTTLQPGALGLILGLEDLHLENNNIAVIYNDTFANCSKLLNLFLEHNNIKIIQEGAFATLHALQNMSLAHNSLHTLPTTLPQYMKHFSVLHNTLQGIPHLRLHNLTFLSLCNNSIATIDPQQIDAKGLQELCLGGIFFKLTDKLITRENFPALESLNLRGTSQNYMEIDDGTIRNIQLMSATSLRKLELQFCRIASTRLFSGANSSLHTLRITNVEILAVRTRVPPQFKLPSIVVLDLSGSSSLALSFLTSSSSIMASVKVLKMPHCSITSFSKSKKEQIVPNITHLDISHNPLTCDCELKWIPDHVRDGKLTLTNEKNTICRSPKHLRNIPLLTATLCPTLKTLPTMTVPELTVNTMSSENAMLTPPPTEGLSEWSTNTPGDTTTNASHPDLPSSTPKGLSQKHMILVILISVAVTILAAFLLMIIGRKIQSHYRQRTFNVYGVIYN